MRNTRSRKLLLSLSTSKGHALPARLPPYRLLRSADGWTPEFEAQFRHFYRSILAKAFPDADLRESAARMRRLADPLAFGGHDPWGYITLMLIHDGRAWKPSGGILYEWYRGGGAVLVTYVVVSPAFRRRGMAQVLFGSALQHLARTTRLVPGISLPIFAETETLPRHATRAETKEAEARFAMLRRLGFRLLDFPYVQPPLSPGKQHVRHLRLLAYQPSALPVPMPAAAVETFLSVFYRALIGDALTRDADCQAVLRALRGMKTIAALPLISHNARGADEAGGRDERGSPLAER